MKLAFLTIATLSLSSFASLKAQTKHDLDRIDTLFDRCNRAHYAAEPDGGEEGWPQCQRPYIKSLDSLEKVAFGHLITTAASSKRDSLNVIEANWYRKRDAYYKYQDDNVESVFTFPNKVDYLEKHIRFLIKQRKSLERQKKS
jgi:hypothetical protein